MMIGDLLNEKDTSQCECLLSQIDGLFTYITVLFVAKFT